MGCTYTGVSCEDSRRDCADCQYYTDPKANLARHILVGEKTRQEADYPTTEDEIKDALKDLTIAMLNKVAIYITDLRRAAWTLEEAPTTPKPPSAPDGHPETFQGLCERSKNPIPLGGENEG